MNVFIALLARYASLDMPSQILNDVLWTEASYRSYPLLFCVWSLTRGPSARQTEKG